MACLFGKVGILGWVSGGFWDRCPVVLNGVWVIFGLMSGDVWWILGGFLDGFPMILGGLLVILGWISRPFQVLGEFRSKPSSF